MRKMNTILVISIALGCIAVLCCVIADGIEPTSLAQGKPQETLESDSNQERAKRYEEPVTAFSTGDTDQEFSVPKGGPEADVKIRGTTATITITTTDGGPVAVTITVASIDGVLRYIFDAATASVTFSNGVTSKQTVIVTVVLSSSGPTVTYDTVLLQATSNPTSVSAFQMLITTATAAEEETFNQVVQNFVGTEEFPLISYTCTGPSLGYTLKVPPNVQPYGSGGSTSLNTGSLTSGLDLTSLMSGLKTGGVNTGDLNTGVLKQALALR